MSSRTAIYAAGPEDTAEVRRTLRICLAGMRPPAALVFEGGDFHVWAGRVFLPVLAPHALRVHLMALRGDAAGVAAADLSLDLPPASIHAGRELLGIRAGARYLPVGRRFAAAVAAGQAAGYFPTVMALQAADFSIAFLPLLQSLLYCEWRGGQSAGAARELEDFFHHAGSVLHSLPTLLTPHAQGFTIPVARAL